MGTKNKPGAFDCYSKAEPDEPMFVLLGRDPLAALLVVLWADVRQRMGGTEPEMIEEARQCAIEMAKHCLSLGKGAKQENAMRALNYELQVRPNEPTEKTVSMIKGLVRFAELREQDEPGGKVWDDKSREALELAREFGWGKDRVGRLP